MKKIVPFKKDISFETNLAEINSISLEHEITDKEENLIAGNFIVSGDYKMADTSIGLDPFEYNLPFNINIDKKYNAKEASIDISDFYYEIINNRILSVNIELAIDNIEEVKEEVMEKEEKEVEEKIPEIEDTEEDRNVESVKSIFDSLSDTDEYVTYKIHIVTENDTLESIANDYSVTKEDLSLYNDLTEVKIGDKIIVPESEN